MVVQALRDTEFGPQFEAVRLRCGMSGNKLSKRVGIDPSYLRRIEMGEREAPSRTVLARLIECLPGVTREERDQLYVAARRMPPSLEELGWDLALREVIRLLTYPGLTDHQRACYRRGLLELSVRTRVKAGIA